MRQQNIDIKKELNRLENFSEQIISDIKCTREQMVSQSSKLYWTSIRMQNNKTVYQEADRECVEELCQALDGLLSIQDDMLKIAEDFQSDVKKIITMVEEVPSQESDQQMEIVEYTQMVNTKINALYSLYITCSKEKKAFEKEVERVELILREKSSRKKMKLKEKMENIFGKT